MNNVYLSKSRYCKCIQCMKIIWLSMYKKECAVQTTDESIFETGNLVGEYAKGLFGEYEDVEFNRNLNVMVDKTKKLLENKPNIITEASFIYDNNFCSVDILVNDMDGVEIYEVKSSTQVKDIYLDDASYQYYVLSNLGLNVKKACIVYINNEYVRQKNLDINKLFKIADITDIAVNKQEEIRDNISLLNRYMESYDKDNEPKSDLDVNCFSPYMCDFWQYCTRNLPKPNVFDISGMWTSKKFEKYKEGIVTFEDLQHEDLNEKYLEQIDFELNDRKPKINREAINKMMKSLRYPLYFIDYETYNLAIPEYENTRAYQQLPFQYSLHIIRNKGDDVIHREFLADENDNEFMRHFAERMTEDMHEDGSIIVYNKSFESKRNEELAQMYPEFKDDLLRFNDNMVDFLEIFRDRHYYTRQMNGSYSIKAVLPALFPDNPNLDYDNLSEVHHGAEASNAFKNLKDKREDERMDIRDALLEYCKLDTYALVKLYERFTEIIED